MKHTTPGRLLTELVHIELVGCGGSGSQMLTGLARLNMALLSLGHPGLTVSAYDPDKVTHANIGRQLFSPADVGQFKASVLVNRINLFFGLDWKAVAQRFGNSAHNSAHREHIIIGCVDTAKARREINTSWSINAGYWLDLGNDATTGQVILGGRGLPSVMDRHPELKKARKESNTPSCSLAQALESQDLFINQAITTWALHLLWTLFRKGGTDHHGYYINLTSGRVTPVPVP